MSKHASSVSCSLSKIGHPPHRNGCVFCSSHRFGELEFSLDLFEIMLCVVPLYEFG